MNADLDDWLWKRRGRFLGARHLLSHKFVKLLPIERLPLEEFSRDSLQLIVLGGQYMLRVGVGMVEKDFDLLVDISGCRLTAVALQLTVQERRLALDAADQPDGLTHAVDCDHLTG